MKLTNCFYSGTGSKYVAVIFMLVCTMVFQPDPAEPAVGSALRLCPIAFDLNTVEKQLKQLVKDWGEVNFQVDDVLVRHVSYYIKYYAVQDVERSNQAILRSETYLPFIKYIFRKYKIHEDVAFALPFVESRFNPGVKSFAGAVGMFQFMGPTAIHYGLKVGDNGRDERKEYKKAAKACARYLSDNRRVFVSMILSMASYHHGTRTVTDVLLNCGEGHVRKFGPIFRNKRLGPFSKEYLPACLAAALIYRYLKQNKLTKLAVSEFKTRTLGSRTSVKALKKQAPDLFEMNPDLLHAKFSYPYVGTNGYVLLSKINHASAVARIKKYPDWAQNPAPAVSGGSRIDGVPRIIHYTAQSYNDLAGIAAIFGTSVKALKFINSYSMKRHLLPGDVVEIRGMAPSTQILDGKSTVCGQSLEIKTLKNETLQTFCKRVRRTIGSACTKYRWQMGEGLSPALIYYWNHDFLGEIQPDTPMEEGLNLKVYSDYRWEKIESKDRR